MYLIKGFLNKWNRNSMVHKLRKTKCVQTVEELCSEFSTLLISSSRERRGIKSGN